MARVYLDFKRFYTFNQRFACIVTRSKTNATFRRLYSRDLDKSSGLRYDQTIDPAGRDSETDYPEKIQRVTYGASRTRL